jgi:hypothetical protein
MTQTTLAAQIAYEILSPLGCEDFDEHLKRSTTLIAKSLNEERKETIEELATLFDDQADSIRAHNIREIMKRKSL